jgi:Arm DNA-binding domain
MASERHLTDRALKALAPAKPGERYELRDSIVAGFGVRVNDERDPSRPGKAGHVSFILYTRFPGSGAPTRRALGRYGELTLEAARSKAAHWRELIARASIRPLRRSAPD